MQPSRRAAVVLILPFLIAAGPADYRKPGQPVAPVSETMIVAEAEEFQVAGKGGWQARPWGENYYVATFANSFLSRKAFLGAPEQCEPSTATIEVDVPKAGTYLALVRYEAAYRFETQFQLQVEQNGKILLDRRYGARDNLKVWAFREKLKKEVAWSWGAGENFVWEGHDATVSLAAGKAKLSLIAGPQKNVDAARRNVDVVVLTSDSADVAKRIENENYLPLDGLLTQAGDVFVKVHNRAGSADMTLTVPNGTEHSPYWVHTRTWKPKEIKAKSGESTGWTEVGSLLDTLNDGQWTINAQATGPQAAGLNYSLEFGVRAADGSIASVRRFDNLRGAVTLAYDADTRWSRRIRMQEEVLYDLVDYLKKQPIRGKAPTQTLIYGAAFDPKPGDAKYTAASEEFNKLIGATGLNRADIKGVDTVGSLVRGYVDWRGQTPAQLEKTCEEIKKKGLADRIAVVSLGDEIGLAAPTDKVDEGFRAWLQTQKLKPADLDPAATVWGQIKYSPGKEIGATKPALMWYSRQYQHRFGIRQIKELTDVLKKHLPNAGIGANFSPHHKNLYLGDTYHWISVFREDGMTMPWGEDYIWQVPVGTQQMNFLMVDMFRCGIQGKPNAKIHYYVMSHTPGNTVANWRRQFYGDIQHGVKIFNLFEFRPVQAAYTENHCSDPAMFQGVRVALHELGTFEDIVQSGQVRQGQAALWFSEAADVWGDYDRSLGAAKRSLYIAIRHQQAALDCILDGDRLKPYKVLYLTDRHVSRSGSKAIAAWVKDGGRLFATAGAGMFDEFNQPNTVLREVLGVTETALEHAAEDVTREKEHLPFAKPLDTVTMRTNATEVKMPVLGARSRFTAAKSAHIMGDFGDGSPAVVMNSSGKGTAYYCGFLPGLSYFQPAIPKRPVDRGAVDDTMSHFIPTKFDRWSSTLVGTPLESIDRPVVCSEPLVESSVIESKAGTLIPLVNWTSGPVKGLTVRVSHKVPTAVVARASGKPMRHTVEGGVLVLVLDLEEADALILQ